MKLLIAADIFPPEAGGPATYCVTLANELVKLGDQVTIVSLNPNSDKKVLDNRVRLFPVAFKNKPLRYAHYFWLLWKYATTADVLYAMGPVNAGWPVALVARLQKKRFVVKVVGDYAWEQGQVLGLTKDGIDEFQPKMYGGKIADLKNKERQVVRAADIVITPCVYLKNMVVGWGAKSEKVKVVYNAVEFTDVAPADKPAGERWVVTAARLTPWKGIQALMEAIGELRPSMPDIKLKVVGSGPELSLLQAFAVEQKLSDAVEFLGAVPRPQALSYIKAADVFVLNSGYEGMSHVILEALNLGTPVLASDAGGNPEIVGDSSLFAFNTVAEMKNKIAAVLAQPATSAAQKANSVSQSDTFFSITPFNTVTMILDTKKILESVCRN